MTPWNFKKSHKIAIFAGMKKRKTKTEADIQSLFPNESEKAKPSPKVDSETPISGYRIYAPKQQEKIKHNDLPELYPDLPNEKYEIVYADPPWDYGGKMQFDKSSLKKENEGWERDIFISAANFKYPTVKTKDLMKFPIPEICADNCLLFMWSTSPHLAQAIELGKAWGFEYKTIGFIWDKMNHNPGQYTLSNCEVCLIFKKGKIPTPRGARNVQQLVRVPRTQHSVKPNEVRQGIERMFPTQKKIELFARQKPEGWDVWGLDIREEREE